MNNNSDTLVPIADLITDTYKRLINSSVTDKERYTGLKTGFDKLDQLTNGLLKSDLIVIASRPAMGKTSFAMNIALNIAGKYNKKTAVFSLEKNKEQLTEQLLLTESRIDRNIIRDSALKDDDIKRLSDGAERLRKLPLLIDDTTLLTVNQIESKLKEINDLDLVIIDDLQSLADTIPNINFIKHVSDTPLQLKEMAARFYVPVILLSQLPRRTEFRQDKRPLLSDFNKTDLIVKAADIIIFLYRDSYYNYDTSEPNVCECIVAKNRHGETGTIKLIWDGQLKRFHNS